jgi:putative ABC transport system permease protein
MKRRTFYIKMVASSMIRRRSRMLVALLAVAIGAAILSGMITIYIDIPRQMGQEFRQYGTNLILVPGAEQTVITEEAVQQAVAVIPTQDIVGVAPYRYQTVRVNEQPIMAAATNLAEVQKTSPYWLVNGQWPGTDNAILVGQEVADLLRLKAGDSIVITVLDTNDATQIASFEVAGVVQTGGSEEAFLFMQLADLEQLTGQTGIYDVVECSITTTEQNLLLIASQIDSTNSGVNSRLVKKVTSSEDAVLTKLQALVYLVTVVILLLTMICVATTMMAVVAERRKEIALRKALGASNRGIIQEFLGEGVFLGVFGGLIGAGLGFVFAQIISVNVFERSIMFLPLLLPITVVISVLVTVLACLIPVRQTTDVDPAVVLKGE